MHILTNLLPLLQFIATEPDIWHPTQIYCCECECEFFPEIKRRKNSNDFEEATEAVTFVYVNIVTGSRFAIIKIRDLHSVFIRLFFRNANMGMKRTISLGGKSHLFAFLFHFVFSSSLHRDLIKCFRESPMEKKKMMPVWFGPFFPITLP